MPDDDGFSYFRVIEYFLIPVLIIVLVLVCAIALSQPLTPPVNSSVVIVETPAPTPELTVITTPTPEPELNWANCKGCLQEREWTWWFRGNANNFGESLRTWTTVYGHAWMPRFHIWSVSWARRFVEKPDEGYKFLFIFVNMYSDSDDARQYLFPKEHWVVQVEDRLYYPETQFDPAVRITELDEVWNYGHVESVKPYGYKIKQEIGTGIISAIPQDTLYWGRSNAADGYIIYMVPEYANDNNTLVIGDFANLGGKVMWRLNGNVTYRP